MGSTEKRDMTPKVYFKKVVRQGLGSVDRFKGERIGRKNWLLAWKSSKMRGFLHTYQIRGEGKGIPRDLRGGSSVGRGG